MQRAIETRYKQRLFRSRLEARYAVLFDALEIKWDYEPEGFDLGGGLWYLPDFFLHMPASTVEARKYPGAGYWAEIKGKDPTEAEKHKFSLLCKQTGHSGYIFTGSPGEGRTFRCNRPGHQNPNVGKVYEEGMGEQHSVFNLKWNAAINLCSPIYGSKGFSNTFDTARARALSARFEFGARP